MRVPDSANQAGSEQQRREVVIEAWVETVSKTYPLRKDRPQTFITRKGRKVGVHAARADETGLWEFSFPDRPVNVVVLLAEDNGYLHDYVLPPKFLQEHWERFESDPHGSGKTKSIHMRQQNGPVILVGKQSVPIEKYEGQRDEQNYFALE